MNGFVGRAVRVVSLAEKVGLGRLVLLGEAPAIGTADDEATFFKGLQSVTEPGVVDAQLPTQRRS